MTRPIASLPEFYAHAIAIEREAVRCYRECDRHFTAQGEDALARICRELADQEERHFSELQDRASATALPRIEEGDYAWLGSAPPEGAARELAFRISTPRQLLELALLAENSAREFYEATARTTPDAAVRALATAMAMVEEEHVRRMLLILEELPPALDHPRH